MTEPIATGYAAALSELDSILASLERSDVDVDVLATQVTRASELIGFCRDRIGMPVFKSNKSLPHSTPTPDPHRSV